MVLLLLSALDLVHRDGVRPPPSTIGVVVNGTKLTIEDRESYEI